MNCQDIAPVIDRRRFGALTDAERRDAEAHARSCAHCLPLWFAHAHVVAMPIPSMPPELARRWRKQAAAAPAAVQGAAPRRQIVVIAGLVALAAAAGMLLVKTADAPAPQMPVLAGHSPEAAPAATPRLQIAGQQSAAPEDAALPVAEVQPRPVPRLPAPLDSDQTLIAQRGQALQKLVELHPQLVQGPLTEEVFAAIIVLRADGVVLSHAMQPATRETSRAVNTELAKLVPTDGGESVLDLARRGTQLPDGSVLRGNLSYQHLTVPASYDPSRSNLRVMEILRANDGLTFLDGAGANYLTVLLSEKGAILQKDVELLSTQEMQQRVRAGTAERASDIARRLDIGVEQIGLMGFTSHRDATDGRPVYVDYAWLRRSGESAPIYRQAGDTSLEDGVNTAWALALVEQVMPEAFARAEHEAGQPVVVLSQAGEVIRTGRRKPGVDSASQMQELVPGLVSEMARTVILKNSKGEEAAVYFVWEASPTKREQIETARKAASGR